MIHQPADGIHLNNVGSYVVGCTYFATLYQENCHLVAAMRRAGGIPAGFCYQVLSKDPPCHGTEVHGLNGIFLSSVGRWIRLDARGNTGAINAQFGLDREQLAFPVDPTRGEYTDETIYAEPLPVVINCLRRFTTRSQMWPHLPESLDQVLSGARSGCTEVTEGPATAWLAAGRGR